MFFHDQNPCAGGRFVCIFRTRFILQTENTRAFRTRTVRRKQKRNRITARYAKRPERRGVIIFVTLLLLEL